MKKFLVHTGAEGDTAHVVDLATGEREEMYPTFVISTLRSRGFAISDDVEAAFDDAVAASYHYEVVLEVTR